MMIVPTIVVMPCMCLLDTHPPIPKRDRPVTLGSTVVLRPDRRVKRDRQQKPGPPGRVDLAPLHGHEKQERSAV